jgi:hypothetical protein
MHRYRPISVDARADINRYPVDIGRRGLNSQCGQSGLRGGRSVVGGCGPDFFYI